MYRMTAIKINHTVFMGVSCTRIETVVRCYKLKHSLNTMVDKFASSGYLVTVETI